MEGLAEIQESWESLVACDKLIKEGTHRDNVSLAQTFDDVPWHKMTIVKQDCTCVCVFGNYSQLCGGIT